LADSSIGLKLWVNEKDRQGVVAALRAGRSVVGHEYQFNVKNGKVITGLFSAQMVHLSQGICILSSINDITGRKRAEEALQESVAKFRDTVQNLDEGYYSCSIDGLILDYNLAFSRILGIDPAKDMMGQKLPDFWQDPQDRKPYLKELMENESIRNYLINAKKMNGEMVVVLASSHIVRDENDRPVRIDGTFTDFTGQKRMQDALKESEAKYRELFESAQIGMYRSTLDGSAFLAVNKKFAEIMGFERDQLLGTPGRIRWADPGERGRVLSLLRERGGTLVNYETRVLTKDGDARDVVASIELHQEAGYLEGTMADISERKRAEGALTDSELYFRTLTESLPELVWT
jgi:two-component system cell cycle sensor histidine kinase/response regulator CckA